MDQDRVNLVIIQQETEEKNGCFGCDIAFHTVL
jgi:hypothetical protein